MVIGEQNEVLRFIAGSIIRQLASQGVCQDLFWPSDGSIAIRSNFFESQLDSSQWPELLEGYLDEMDSQLKNHEQYVSWLKICAEWVAENLTGNSLHFRTFFSSAARLIVILPHRFS